MKQFIFKSAVFTLITLCGFTPLKAKQFTGKVIVNTPLEYDDGVRDVTYNYTVDNDGNRILNGMFSIKGTHKYSGRVPGLGTLTESGTYRLSANYKNDELNGTMNVSANYTETANSWGRVESNNYKYSLTGSFVNGLPNGAFNVTSRNGGMPSYARVNFKKGVLVGAFSCETYYDHGFSYKYTGTLTADGQLTGRWTVNTNDNYKKETYSFLNGVLLSYSSKKEDTTPKETELAKKYATKAITQEELLAMGYVVIDDSFKLGEYVNNVILSGAIAPWGKKNGLFGYSFSSDNNKRYQYLKKLDIVNDSQLQIFLKKIESYFPYCPSEFENSPNYRHQIFMKEYGMYYIRDYSNKYYFTDEQMHLVDSIYDIIKKNRAFNLPNLYSYTRRLDMDEKTIQFIQNGFPKNASANLCDLEDYTKSWAKKLLNVEKKLLNSYLPTSLAYLPLTECKQFYIYKDATGTDVYVFKNSIDEFIQIKDSTLCYKSKIDEFKTLFKNANILISDSSAYEYIDPNSFKAIWKSSYSNSSDESAKPAIEKLASPKGKHNKNLWKSYLKVLGITDTHNIPLSISQLELILPFMRKFENDIVNGKYRNIYQRAKNKPDFDSIDSYKLWLESISAQ